MGDEGSAIILDSGSQFTKIGYSGEDEPKSIYHTIQGRPNFQELIAAESKDVYIGNDAYKNRGLLSYKYPIKRGTIDKWEDWCSVLKYGFESELRVDPTEYPVHITEPIQAPAKQRVDLLKYFFEKLEVPAFYISNQALQSVYATGNTTGLAIEVGDGITQIVPVSNGFTLKHASCKVELAGRDVTEFLMDTIYLGNHNISDCAAFEIVREMKEKVCRVGLDYETDLKSYQGKDGKSEMYKLPDGHTYEVKHQCLMASEILFQPKLDCRDIPGQHWFAKECINKADIDLRPELCSLINFSGGGSMLNGFTERFQQELQSLLPEDCTVNINAPDDRKDLCWLGGSVLTSLESFDSMWITKEEYEEYGDSILQKKVLS